MRNYILVPLAAVYEHDIRRPDYIRCARIPLMVEGSCIFPYLDIYSLDFSMQRVIYDKYGEAGKLPVMNIPYDIFGNAFAIATPESLVNISRIINNKIDKLHYQFFSPMHLLTCSVESDEDAHKIIIIAPDGSFMSLSHCTRTGKWQSVLNTAVVAPCHMPTKSQFIAHCFGNAAIVGGETLYYISAPRYPETVWNDYDSYNNIALSYNNLDKVHSAFDINHGIPVLSHLHPWNSDNTCINLKDYGAQGFNIRLVDTTLSSDAASPGAQTYIQQGDLTIIDSWEFSALSHKASILGINADKFGVLTDNITIRDSKFLQINISYDKKTANIKRPKLTCINSEIVWVNMAFSAVTWSLDWPEAQFIDCHLIDLAGHEDSIKTLFDKAVFIAHDNNPTPTLIVHSYELYKRCLENKLISRIVNGVATLEYANVIFKDVFTPSLSTLISRSDSFFYNDMIRNLGVCSISYEKSTFVFDNPHLFEYYANGALLHNLSLVLYHNFTLFMYDLCKLESFELSIPHELLSQKCEFYVRLFLAEIPPELNQRLRRAGIMVNDKDTGAAIGKLRLDTSSSDVAYMDFRGGYGLGYQAEYKFGNLKINFAAMITTEHFMQSPSWLNRDTRRFVRDCCTAEGMYISLID